MTPRSACYAVLSCVAFTVACLPGPFGPAVWMGATFLHVASRHAQGRAGSAAATALAALGPASVAAHAVAPLSPWAGVAAAFVWAAPFALVGATTLRRPWLAATWTSFAWTATEVAWGHEPSLGRFATPFLTIATAWVDTPWIAAAAWVGSSGLTLATLLVAGAWTAWFDRPLRAVATAAAWTVAVGAAASWTTPSTVASTVAQTGTTTSVRLVQPNVSRQELAAMPLDPPTLERHRTFLADHLGLVSDTDWWVAPESTIPWPLSREGDAVDADAWAHVLPYRGLGWFGAPTRDVGGRLRNGVIAWRDGRGTVVADKTVRVPWLEDALTPGEPADPFVWEGVHVASLVCFEVAFPHVVRQAARRGATALIVVANDAYAGRGPLAALHLRIARLRAAEVGLPLVFVQNTGPSAATDARGTVVGSMPGGARGSVQIGLDLRPLARAPRRRGDLVGPTSWLVTLVVGAVRLRRSAREGVRLLDVVRVAESPTT